MKKTVYIIVGVIIFLVIAGFITKTIIEKVTRDITEREIRRITGGETDRITQAEIERITKEKTKEVTRGILAGSTSGSTLKDFKCEKTPASTTGYSGPLFDAHLHMPFTFDAPKAIYAQADWDAPFLEKEVAAGLIICDFENTKTKGAFGFSVIPNLLKGQAVQLLQQVDKKHPNKIALFLMPAHVSGLDLKPADYKGVLEDNPGLFKGIGELAFYKGSLKGISPDDPLFQEIYEIAAEQRLVVMIHPDQGQQQAIENVVKNNPTVNFLFHGNEEPYLFDLVGKYPNVYYSIDTQLNDIPKEHKIGNLYGAESKEDFLKDMIDYEDEILSVALATWESRIERYPDRFLWGTDRAWAWHFDPEVTTAIDKISRKFIAQLDPSVQEKFAYKNAERLINLSRKEGTT